MKKLLVILLVAVLVIPVGATAALFVIGLVQDDSVTQRSEQSGSRTPPFSDLAAFYDQDLTWQPCKSAECSTLTVPLNYADPAGKRIDLALLRVPAQSQENYQGPLLVNPGGPGAPGTEYAAAAAMVFGADVVRDYDIVGFDPRGTGDSAPVDCLTDDELDAYLASDPAPDDAAEVTEATDWARRLGKGCSEKSGDLANHVSTIEAARDMDVMRAALGREKLAYFGASYGTKLGATYTELFPERVGRFVLDGAVDLNLSSKDLALGQAGGFETALRAYAEDYVQGCADSCVLGRTGADVLTSITTLIDEVDANPLPASGRQLQVGNAFYGVVMPLYNQDYWPLLTQALERAEDGDGSSLMTLADLYASRSPSGYVNNSSEAIYAINCLDDPWAIESAQVPASFPEFEKVSPTFGAVFAWGQIGWLGMTSKRTEKPLTIDGAGAAPLLVIGTTRDPATPMAWAESMAKQLDSAILVRRDGDGHTGYNAGNACVDSTVEDYLIKGTVPAADVSC